MHKVISDHDTSVSKNRGIPKWMIYNGKPYYISDHDTVDSRSSTKISLALRDGFFAMYIPNTHGLWHGAILQPRKMCLKKVVLFNFRNPPTKDVFFFTFSKGRYHNRPPHRRKLEASFFRVFLLCPWKFRHPTCVRFRGVFTSVESTEINGEPRHLPTGGERGGISRPNITLPETNSKST